MQVVILPVELFTPRSLTSPSEAIMSCVRVSQVTGTLMSAPSEVTAVTLEGSVGMTPGFVARKTSFREATSTEE